jgi:predicted adenylyl cyclase CyaB
MPSNIEIKARVDDPDRLRLAAAGLASEPPRVLDQEDVFFRTEKGRLKLRTLGADRGQLIYYQRPDTPGCKQSRYRIHETRSPAELRGLLAAALGETVTVRKRREVYLAGQTRIHLDEVRGLGTFVELEVVLRPGQPPEEGREIARDLMRKLGVEESRLVACAYADLVSGRT